MEESKKLDDLAKFMGEQQEKLNALKTNPCDDCEIAHTSCCCNAEIIMGDICADCREHTDDCCDECEDSDDTQYQRQKSDESNYLLYLPRI